jgi:peroxiredoxin
MAVAGILVALTGLVAIGAALGGVGGAIGPGVTAPDFDAVDVATGDTVALRDYRGKVVLLNIWATWCKPCEEEMPSIQRLYEELGPEGFEVVAVSIDKDGSEKVRDWVEARGLTFDVLHDQPGRIQRTYQTTGVPESFVINRDGLVVKRQIGAVEWDRPATAAIFRRLLASERSSP